MKQSVLGFVHDGVSILLLRKTHPPEQVNRFNGIGGPVREGETPAEAMDREGMEEVGLREVAWVYRLTVERPDETVHVFAATHNIHAASQCEAERFTKFLLAVTDWNREPVVTDLKWIIHMILDNTVEPATIRRTA